MESTSVSSPSPGPRLGCGGCVAFVRYAVRNARVTEDDPGRLTHKLVLYLFGEKLVTMYRRADADFPEVKDALRDYERGHQDLSMGHLGLLWLLSVSVCVCVWAVRAPLRSRVSITLDTGGSEGVKSQVEHTLVSFRVVWMEGCTPKCSSLAPAVPCLCLFPGSAAS